MKFFYAVITTAALVCTSAQADTSALNLALPGASQNNQSDKFRSGELDCSNAIGSATQMEFGVTGIIENGGYDPMSNFINERRAGDVGVYARIVIPLGKVARNRIDCNELFELELRRKQLELMKLEQELQQLRQLQFEN